MARGADPNKMAKLQDAMSRASKLMQLESNGTLDKIAKSHKGEIDASLNGNDITTESMMTTSRRKSGQPPMINEAIRGAGAENVPSIIRESFANNRIDESVLYQAFTNDGKDVSFLNEIAQARQEPVQAPSSQQIRQIVNEGITQQSIPQQIDYPMIRTIVEEIVRKYAVSLKNKILTEDKQNMNEVNTVMLGKSFKFLAKNGDIYEAKLTKVGNINDKKKSVNE